MSKFFKVLLLELRYRSTITRLHPLTFPCSTVEKLRKSASLGTSTISTILPASTFPTQQPGLSFSKNGPPKHQHEPTTVNRSSRSNGTVSSRGGFPQSLPWITGTWHRTMAPNRLRVGAQAQTFGRALGTWARKHVRLMNR